MPAADELYARIAHANAAEQQLLGELAEAKTQLESREQELQAERDQAEASGDTETVTRIDDELDELERTLRVVTDHLDDDATAEHQDRDRDRNERSGDSNDPGDGR